MFVFFLILIGGFAVLAGVALVRGLMAFSGDGEMIRRGLEPNFLQRGEQQNRMMMQRVMFQGAAIVLVAVLGMLAAKS